MQQRDGSARWQMRKAGLKRDLGCWAIRHEDATFALDAWRAFWTAHHAKPCDFFAVQRALVAFVAAYGRIFTGELGVPSKAPFVRPDDKELHDVLMRQRHEAVAHSDWSFRSVHIYPPGSTRDGLPPTNGWSWMVRASELRVQSEQVESLLEALKKLFAERAFRAHDLLLEHCREQAPPTSGMPLDDF